MNDLLASLATPLRNLTGSFMAKDTHHYLAALIGVGAMVFGVIEGNWTVAMAGAAAALNALGIHQPPPDVPGEPPVILPMTPPAKA